MFIGIDDTDSERGLCTTYLAAVLMDRLRPFGELVGLPKLVRLNPCAPFKTRGNAAIAFQFETERPKEVRDLPCRPSQSSPTFPARTPTLAWWLRTWSPEE